MLLLVYTQLVCSNMVINLLHHGMGYASCHRGIPLLVLLAGTGETPNTTSTVTRAEDTCIKR